MAITVSEILTVVNDDLGFSETNIDAKVRKVLKDITDRGDFLNTVGTLTAAASTAYISFPSDMRPGCIPIITIDGGEPLTYWADPNDYYINLADDDSEDEPTHFTKIGDKFYFWPTWSTAAAALTNVIAYAQIHPDAVTTILLGEPFRKALEQGVKAEVLEAHQRYKEALLHKQFYEAEIRKRSPDLPPRAHYIRYNDLGD